RAGTGHGDRRGRCPAHGQAARLQDRLWPAGKNDGKRIMTNRGMRYAVTIALAVVLLGLGAFAIHRAFVYEEPMLSGPLTADLLAAREPETRRQDLGAVFAQFIPEDAALAAREPVLVANGFNCFLRPANVEGNTMLSCVRPVEG